MSQSAKTETILVRYSFKTSGSGIVCEWSWSVIQHAHSPTNSGPVCEWASGLGEWALYNWHVTSKNFARRRAHATFTNKLKGNPTKELDLRHTFLMYILCLNALSILMSYFELANASYNPQEPNLHLPCNVNVNVICL